MYVLNKTLYSIRKTNQQIIPKKCLEFNIIITTIIIIIIIIIIILYIFNRLALYQSLRFNRYKKENILKQWDPSEILILD
jgi:uncharacterized membrane protein YvbJ